MIALSLAEAAGLLEARLDGANRDFRGVSTDTRTLVAGELFFALSGPHFDAHEKLAEAAAAGAAGAVVARPVSSPLARIVVDETRAALGLLARGWRQRFKLPLFGVTGSAGKTTVKEMLGAIVRRNGPALVTAGNLNNDIGVPLTLFKLAAEHRAAVIEMGASRAGDIATLAAIAQPGVGVITLCAPSHLEGFGDLETVARTKGELLTGLAADGTAVLNNEDDFLPLWRELAAHRRIMTFGRDGDVHASDIVPDGACTGFRLHSPAGVVSVRLPARGRHNVNNALAAAAAALAAGIALEQIAAGLAETAAVAGRLVARSGPYDAAFIDDTYNANPASLAAALEVLASAADPRWLVFGDMGELGEQAEALHRDAADAARRAGVERVFAIGELARVMQRSFGSGAQHFDDPQALIEALGAALADARPAPTVLFKGSRFMALDRIVAALVERPC